MIADLGRPFVDVNCTTDHEVQTHTISIFWKVDPPANLNLTPEQISYRLADTRADIYCDSTNRTVTVSLSHIQYNTLILYYTQYISNSYYASK